MLVLMCMFNIITLNYDFCSLCYEFDDSNDMSFSAIRVFLIILLCMPILNFVLC